VGRAALPRGPRRSDLSVPLLGWLKRGHGVDGDEVEGTAAHQGVDNLQSHRPIVRTGNEQQVEVETDPTRVLGVKGEVGINERGQSAVALCRTKSVQEQRGNTGGLGAEDLHDAPAAGRPHR
jgi:hypothetical protein